MKAKINLICACYHNTRLLISPASKVKLLDNVAYLLKAMGIYMIDSGGVGDDQKR
jgi:hypothetical protein